LEQHVLKTIFILNWVHLWCNIGNYKHLKSNLLFPDFYLTFKTKRPLRLIVYEFHLTRFRKYQYFHVGVF